MTSFREWYDCFVVVNGIYTWSKGIRASGVVSLE